MSIRVSLATCTAPSDLNSHWAHRAPWPPVLLVHVSAGFEDPTPLLVSSCGVPLPAVRYLSRYLDRRLRRRKCCYPELAKLIAIRRLGGAPNRFETAMMGVLDDRQLASR